MDESDRRPSPRIGISPRIAESIAADLRLRILRGEQTNVPLPRQEDLIRQYGVSGPSLREALRILEAEGLITVRRGKFGGAFVHKPDWASASYALALSMQGQGVTLSDLADSLLILEPMCAAACARRGDRASTLVPALKANLEQAEQAIGDAVRYSAVSREFHDLVVAGEQNETVRLLVRTLVAVWSIQERTWADTVSAVSEYPGADRQQESFRTHSAIVHLIEEGEADRVQSLAAAHLKATQSIVLERFGSEIVDSSSLAAIQAFKSR